MPTRTERIEPGIYCVHWIAHVKMDEIFQARDASNQLAEEDQVTDFVVVIDGTEVKTLPFDLRMLTKATNDGYLAILVLNAPYAGEVMGRMFNKFSSIQAEFFRDRDALLQRAHALLASVKEESTDV